MSAYPTYSLQVYDFVQKKWVDNASYPAGNEPHAYDRLRQAYEMLVSGAKNGSSNQQPIGYRIMVRGNTIVDSWTNGKV